jgi:antitoxin YefM
MEVNVMYTTYHLNVNELNNNFIKSIKQLFKDKDIEITVSDFDETEYLLSSPENKKRLLESLDNVNNRRNLIEVDSELFK